MSIHIPDLAKLSLTLPGVIYRYDVEHDVTVFVSDGIYKTSGYDPQDILCGRVKWIDLVIEEDKAVVRKHMESNPAKLLSCTAYRISHRNGEVRRVLDRAFTVMEGDRPRWRDGIILDISPAITPTLDLASENNSLMAAINEATIVSVADLKGNIKYANGKFLQICQYSLDELLGKKHSIINSGHHPKKFWMEMWQTIKRGQVWRGEVKNKRKDGTCYWVDTFIIPMRDNANEIFEFLSIRNDITEKKSNEIRLRETLEKAEESERLKSAFLANISHEVRTPMNAIMGLSELLLSDRGNLPQRKRIAFTRLIHERSHDLLQVVNNILDISKIEAGQVSAMPVSGNIRELFDRLLVAFQGETSHVRKKNIAIRAVNHLKVEQYTFIADFLRLHQVMNNLLTNAAKFTNEGAIEFGCRLLSPAELEFWVRDTGIGIPADKLDTIFLPFRQADDSVHQRFGGSGLGLAICKAFVELWSGRITVKSQPGIGSEFYFTMPYVQVAKADHTSSHALRTFTLAAGVGQ